MLPIYRFVLFIVFFSFVSSTLPLASSAQVTISGELRKWHPVTLLITGPEASEDAVINPFYDYRVQVTFSNGGTTLSVPAYFAADGNAAETSATAGNKWKAHFTPTAVGDWQYIVSFRTGTDVAVLDDPLAGSSIASDGLNGTITIQETNKSGKDYKGKGMLRYVGEHYLRFDNGEWHLKGGIDSPENMLAYEDFDGTYEADTDGFVKSFTPHVPDWNPGDPTWQGGKGKGLIGAFNYLSSRDVNGIYFIMVNVGQGDGEDEGNDDVWPWTSHTEFQRYDVSKLEQWDIAFRHAQSKGIMLHLVLQEIDNDRVLDGGDLGRMRKLYYREMVARFGYHNAVMWNIGEEMRADRQTDAQRKSYIDYVAFLDAYDHPIVVHTWPGGSVFDEIYGSLLGYPTFSGISFQIHEAHYGTGGLKVYDFTKDWYYRSLNAGRKLPMFMDECCGWRVGVTPFGTLYNLDEVRTDVLWGNLMAGGAGSEWYFGDDKVTQPDLATEDFRPYEDIFDYTRIARDFFFKYLDFTKMKPLTDLSNSDEHLVLGHDNEETYLVYLRRLRYSSRPSLVQLDLNGQTGTYEVDWFNPRAGGSLLQGSLATVDAGGLVDIGDPPHSLQEDWVALVRKRDPNNYVTAIFEFTQQSNPLQFDFDASGSNLVGGTITAYEWDFGDGTTASGATASHTFPHPGLYTVQLTVRTSTGNFDTFSIPIVTLTQSGNAVAGLKGSYYDSPDFSGEPQVRIDPVINFVWGFSPPQWSNFPSDNFTIRWEGMILPDYSENYTFKIQANDGARLWINGQLVIDAWEDAIDEEIGIEVQGSIGLDACIPASIVLEMRELTDRASAKLFWESPNQPEQIVPYDKLFYSEEFQLPVELINFRALASDGAIYLNWQTLSEENNAGFQIERAFGETDFEVIGYVEGMGTTTEEQSYQYIDPNPPVNALNLRYRLKQVDFDGTSACSAPVSVEEVAPSDLALHKNYPNPFNPTTTIQFDLPLSGPVELVIFDMLGRKLETLIDGVLPAGRHQTSFDASNLSSGMYIYQLKSTGKTINRTMILAK